MTYIPRDATYSTNPIKNYQIWDNLQASPYRPNSVQMADALNSLEATNALQAGTNTLQTAAKPVANVIGKAGYLLAPLGEAAMFYGAVDAAKHSDDRIPTYSGDMTITPNAGAPMLPSVQLDNNGNLSYQLQGGVSEDYMLPPQPNKMEGYYKQAKQFYGMMRANPQTGFNVFNNFIQGDNKDLPGLLNGSSTGGNL